MLADWPLKPGQMLLFGPAACRMLRSGNFQPPLPDVHLFERAEWA